ncbi:MAG: lysophospholipid acyltransferase family protein, partial [Nitrospira sp.]|nr:lysophospholipid acyltransferase family protein [Nitrospira sp.]
MRNRDVMGAPVMSDERRTGTSMKKRIERWLKLSVLPPVGAAIVRGLARSMKMESRGHESVDALYREGQSLIITFWHAQQLMVPIGYRGKGANVLISQHQDGEIIARIIARFGHRAVRGSSTRGGAQALRELIRLGRSGEDLGVTPDGPKGPRQVAKLGVVQLAKATGLPIVPMAFSCSKKNSSRAGIGSWSRTPGRAASICGARPSGF